MPTFGGFGSNFSFGKWRQSTPVGPIGTPTSAVGNFTISWWQYMTSTENFPRIFSVGAYPTSAVATSIESGNFYFWANGSNVFSFAHSTILDTWVHFAITRTGTQLRVFKGGIAQTDIATNLTVVNNTTNINDTTNALSIGAEGTGAANSFTPVAQTYFAGRITNFHWIKGTSRFQDNFTPAYPTTSISDTKLLLLANSTGQVITDSSPAPITLINNNGVGWNSSNPGGGGGGSMTFNGTSRYLTAPAGANWALGAPA